MTGSVPVVGSGVLHVVATPIGNLEDVTIRALRVLRDADVIVAEDTRRTRKLLTAHDIPAKTLLGLPAFDERRRVPALVHRLDAGLRLALCTDGGTPVISDPGAELVRAARDAGHVVIPVPGPSAVIAALSGAGLGQGGFAFLGFLPRTPGRLARVLEGALAIGRDLVFYESPLRLARTLELAAAVLGDRKVVVAREMTKIHETFHVGTAAALAVEMRERPPKGECTVLVAA